MNRKLKKFISKVMVLTFAGTMVFGSALTAQAAGLRDVFDMSVYSNYEDLTNAFGTNEKAMFNHYVKYGLNEGRTMTELIDVKKYREAYPDLDAAFGDNWDAYVNHYLVNGFKEGRQNFTKFDARAYADRYPDLKAAFGYDVLALYRHYMEFGRNENRCAETYAPVRAAAPSNNCVPSGEIVEVTGRLVDPETNTAIANAVITATPLGETARFIAATILADDETVSGGDATVSGGDGTVSGGDADTDDDLTDGVFTTVSDENGNYVLNLPEGSYTITATASGYMLLTLDTVVVNADVASVVPTMTLLSESADGESRITGRLTNALNGSALAGATVTLRSNWNNYTGEVVATATTNSDGVYTIDVERGYYTATLSKEGFVTKSMNVISVSETTSNVQHEALTPELVADGSYRVVLTWGETPRDLDSHITGPTEDGEGVFHVYFGDKIYANEAGEDVVTLDYDDTSSFGPETVTVITPQDNAIYRYSVHNWSGEANITTSSATVAVYAGNGLLATFNVPVTGEGIYWNVFEIRDGVLVGLNTISDTSASMFAEELFTE